MTASIAVIAAERQGRHHDALHLAREHDLAFVGEVAVERPLGEAGPLGDLRHRDLVEAVLAVELEGRLPEAAACVGLPAGHGSDLVTAVTVIEW